MEKMLSIINEINKEIESLMLEKEKLSFDNNKLLNERERFIEERGKYVKQISELKEELKNLKLACDMTSSGSKDRAKRSINAVIRDIDACIGLINKR